MRLYEIKWQQPGWHSTRLFPLQWKCTLECWRIFPRRRTAPYLSRVSIERKDEGSPNSDFESCCHLNLRTPSPKTCFGWTVLSSLSWLRLNQRDKVLFSRWESGNENIWPSFPKPEFPSSFCKILLHVRACNQGLHKVNSPFWMFLSFLNLLSVFRSCPLCNLSPRKWVLKPSSGIAPMGVPSTSTAVWTHFDATLSKQKTEPLRLRLCHSDF